jgi:hypothetical protein
MTDPDRKGYLRDLAQRVRALQGQLRYSTPYANTIAGNLGNDVGVWEGEATSFLVESAPQYVEELAQAPGLGDAPTSSRAVALLNWLMFIASVPALYVESPWK